MITCWDTYCRNLNTPFRQMWTTKLEEKKIHEFHFSKELTIVQLISRVDYQAVRYFRDKLDFMNAISLSSISDMPLLSLSPLVRHSGGSFKLMYIFNFLFIIIQFIQIGNFYPWFRNSKKSPLSLFWCNPARDTCYDRRNYTWENYVSSVAPLGYSLLIR
jgi:hypothetical protein